MIACVAGAMMISAVACGKSDNKQSTSQTEASKTQTEAKKNSTKKETTQEEPAKQDKTTDNSKDTGKK